VVGPPVNDVLEVAGPEKFRLDELVGRVLRNNKDSREVTTDVHARYFGTELNDQSLVPAGTPWRIGAMGFETWLTHPTPRA
jgi:hypothetical protein